LGGGGSKRKRSFAAAAAMACWQRRKRLDRELRLSLKRKVRVLDADKAGGVQGRGMARQARGQSRSCAWTRRTTPGVCGAPTAHAWSRVTDAKHPYAEPACARHVAGMGGLRVRALGATMVTLASVSISRAHFQNCKTLKSGN
jgi:hypothetical protein